MKTDKALLLLAAKACNLNVKYISLDADDNVSGLIVGEKNTKNKTKWSPLTDDGDALRLAVKLKFDVMTRWGEPNAAVLDQEGNFTMQADVDLDMRAATRRAIVRAAAAIGEKL